MRLVAAATLGFALLAGAAIAREQIPVETRIEPYSANLPACEDQSVLDTVSSRFSSREGNFWNSPLTIVRFERARQTSFRPEGIDLIPRRFCTAAVVTSDNVRRQLDYNIVEGGGFIGITWGIEWCMGGLDRSYAYAPYCQMARP